MKVIRNEDQAIPSLAPTVWIGSLEKVVSVAREQMSRGVQRENQTPRVRPPVRAPLLTRKSA